MEEKNEVTIVLCGEAGVGKTSLLTRLVSSHFTERLPARSPPITIPEEILAGPESERVSIELVDTYSKREDNDELYEQLKRADAICIVYAVDNTQSRDAIISWWLPEIRKKNPNAPVVILANKIDLIPQDKLGDELNLMKQEVLENCKEVMYCVECSAKEGHFVDEAFGYAKKAVLFPTRPIFDPDSKMFTAKCVQAFKRIFHLLDIGKDNYLDEHELKEFQRTCFGHKVLTQKHIQNIKNTLKKGCPEGLKDKGVNELGFLYLLRRFMEMGKQESIWRILRHFGYGNDLNLTHAFLEPDLGDLLGKVVELSEKGYRFLDELFRRFGRGGAHLSPSQFNKVFETAPQPICGTEYEDQTQTANGGRDITLQGFLSLWSMLTTVEYKNTLRHMGYLGFPGKERSDCVKVLDRNDLENRKVFTCYVFGSAGCGKTALLRRLVEKPFIDDHKPTTEPRIAVDALDNKGHYLIMKELGSKEGDILGLRSEMKKADVVCLVYDLSDPSSFKHIAEVQHTLILRYPLMPCIYVGTKKDKPLAKQAYDEDPMHLCARLSLDMPVKVAIKNDETNDIYGRILEAIRTNKVPTPSTSILYNPLLLASAVGVLAVGCVMFLAMKPK